MANASKFKRNLSETILGIQLVRLNPSITQRMLSFDYVNIQVVWTALGRSLAQLLPFLDFGRVRSLISGGQELTQTVSFASSEADEKSLEGMCMMCGAT